MSVCRWTWLISRPGLRRHLRRGIAANIDYTRSLITLDSEPCFVHVISFVLLIILPGRKVVTTMRTADQTMAISGSVSMTEV